jgi:hypothetical protein
MQPNKIFRKTYCFSIAEKAFRQLAHGIFFRPTGAAESGKIFLPSLRDLTVLTP